MRRVAFVLLLAACSEPTGTVSQGLTTEVKHQRYTLIRDTAAQMGQYNAALLAGIAISETNLAHCQSEATYACQGPASSSCGGGPIIAGAADGPCSAMQGGLGMFQFDAGTYQDTVNTYGPDILTIEGNTAQAVNFVVTKVELDVAGIDTWLAAVDWMNNVPLTAGEPVMEQWASLLACRYNGCCTQSSTCLSRAAGYRDNAISAFNEMGADFWRTADRCSALPADGVIDQRSNCYLAGGDPRYWHRESSGYDSSLEWTKTTTDPAYANFAEWIVKTSGAGRYHVDVHLDGGQFGQSKQAAYQIAHAGATDTVTVDQTSASGWVSLGDFDFTGSGDEHVLLGDNTGEAGAMLAFDAVRVQSLDAPAPDGGCGCQAKQRGGAAAASAVAFALFVLIGRRRRR